MDESIHLCIVAGPYVATHDDDYCPVCQEELHAGDPAITLDEGLGPVTVCRRCGLDRLADLLGDWPRWQG